jgi:hypothetical protein
MKKILSITIVIIGLLLSACKDDEEVIQPVKFPEQGGCSYVLSEIYFADTCSYDFAVNFLSNQDSIEIKDIFMGKTFIVRSDSGDYMYWYNIFINDPGISSFMLASTTTDSLTLHLQMKGDKPASDEEARISSIPHLTLLSIEENEKYISVILPTESLTKWENYFKEFPFIEKVISLYICAD